MSLAGRLTPAHRRIARLVALGYSNAQIAEELTLSPGTIRNQLSTIYERLGVRRCQLVVLVVRWGWISPEEIAAALDAAPEARG